MQERGAGEGAAGASEGGEQTTPMRDLDDSSSPSRQRRDTLQARMPLDTPYALPRADCDKTGRSPPGSACGISAVSVALCLLWYLLLSLNVLDGRITRTFGQNRELPPLDHTGQPDAEQPGDNHNAWII